MQEARKGCIYSARGTYSAICVHLNGGSAHVQSMILVVAGITKGNGDFMNLIN